jgi:signal transduction histidine kinase
LAKEILGGKDEKSNFTILKKILKGKVDLREYIKNCGLDKKRLVFSDIEIKGRYFQFLLSPILTKEKEEICIGIVVLVQDITEAKILERSKDEFFSIASHELRTPLTAIRGNTSMILEYYAEAVKDPELKMMVDDIHESSIRLINIVNDFLNVSRLEQRRMEFKIEKFDISKLVPETIKEYDVTGSRKKIGIEFVAPDGPLPLVNGEMDKVRQVLINLRGNSLKFTAEGGIKIKTEISGKFVKVVVSDTGRGIPLKQQSLLFHKFQQTGESLFTRDTAGGSGLGLYISKMMIEGMGGEIKLEKSEEGKGSTFSFSLPIAKK